jgi:predicted nucleic acid-binding protein
MRVAVDTNVLSLLLHPDTEPPDNPETGKPVEYARERIENLIDGLEASGSRVLVPTPVLSEFLVLTNDAGQNYLSEIDGRAVFEVVPFDQRSAVEAAAAQALALKAGNKKKKLGSTRECVKADRQIVAVAKVAKADRIITSDADVQTIAEQMGVAVTMLWELEIPTIDNEQPSLLPPPDEPQPKK